MVRIEQSPILRGSAGRPSMGGEQNLAHITKQMPYVMEVIKEFLSSVEINEKITETDVVEIDSK